MLLVVLFWLLDAYYLKMERQRRLLYDDAVAGKAAPLRHGCVGLHYRWVARTETILANKAAYDIKVNIPDDV